MIPERLRKTRKTRGISTVLQLDRATQAAIGQHAREAFPDECCGAVLTVDGQQHVRRITNVQNARHAHDPVTYPRNATTAYFMEPRELLAVIKVADEGRAELTAFYHSHPNHAAYFSDEDKAQAMFGDEPSYPDTSYVVIAVSDDDVQAVKAFAWDAAQRDFVETRVRVTGPAQ